MTVADGVPAVRGRSPRAVRPSPEQLDAAILDAAAEVFARHGFAGTSVQQVADTVGYSKTGLLRRFPSKQALYDGVLGHVSACVEGILDAPVSGQGLGAGDGELAPPPTRAAVLRAVTTAAFENPGTVVLVLEALRPGSDLPGTDQVEQTTLRLAGQLTAGIDDPQDRLRALLALQLVATAATLALDPGVHVPELSVSQVHDVALQAAGDVVGVRTT